MKIFDIDPYDFNGDGKVDVFEEMLALEIQEENASPGGESEESYGSRFGGRTASISHESDDIDGIDDVDDIDDIDDIDSIDDIDGIGGRCDELDGVGYDDGESYGFGARDYDVDSFDGGDFF